MCFLIIDSNDIDFIFLSSTFLDENNLSLEFDTIFYSVHCNVKCIAALNLSGTLYTNRQYILNSSIKNLSDVFEKVALTTF